MALATTSKDMLIPGFAPGICIAIDYGEKEVVEQPEMSVILNIETR